jgi:hypothetical protein
MHRNPAVFLALATTLVLSAGCRSGRAGEDTGTLPAPAANERAAVPLIVENHNPDPTTIYAIRAGQRLRVGEVSGVGTETLKIPRDYFDSDGTVRLIADPVGGRAVSTSGPLTVQPGQVVKWTLEPDPAMSAATVE